MNKKSFNETFKEFKTQENRRLFPPPTQHEINEAINFFKQQKEV